jgi:hypothetical protein
MSRNEKGRRDCRPCVYFVLLFFDWLSLELVPVVQNLDPAGRVHELFETVQFHSAHPEKLFRRLDSGFDKAVDCAVVEIPEVKRGALSLCSYTPNLGRFASSLCPDLGFRHTQPRP